MKKWTPIIKVTIQFCGKLVKIPKNASALQSFFLMNNNEQGNILITVYYLNWYQFSHRDLKLVAFLVSSIWLANYKTDKDLEETTMIITHNW